MIKHDKCQPFEVEIQKLKLENKKLTETINSINPYSVAKKIRKEINVINNLFYNCFDTMKSSDRIVLSSAVKALNNLAREVEQEADKDFEYE